MSNEMRDKLDNANFIFSLMERGLTYRDALCEYPWITPEMFTDTIKFARKMIKTQRELMG